MGKAAKKILSLIIIVFLLAPILSCDISTFPEPPGFLANFYGTTFNGMDLIYSESDSKTTHFACPGSTSFLYIGYEGAYALSIGAYVKDLDTIFTCTQNGFLNFSLEKYTQPTNTSPGYWSGTMTFTPDSGKAWGGNFRYYVTTNVPSTILLFDKPIELSIDGTINKYFTATFFSIYFTQWQDCQ